MKKTDTLEFSIFNCKNAYAYLFSNQFVNSAKTSDLGEILKDKEQIENDFHKYLISKIYSLEIKAVTYIHY